MVFSSLTFTPMTSDLPCTVSETVLVWPPSTLVAVHTYSPASACLASEISRIVCRLPVALVWFWKLHRTLGSGFPFAVQFRDTPLPAFTTSKGLTDWISGASMDKVWYWNYISQILSQKCKFLCSGNQTNKGGTIQVGWDARSSQRTMHAHTHTHTASKHAK